MTRGGCLFFYQFYHFCWIMLHLSGAQEPCKVPFEAGQAAIHRVWFEVKFVLEIGSVVSQRRCGDCTRCKRGFFLSSLLPNGLAPNSKMAQITQIVPYGKEARRAALRTLLRAVRTMDNPADILNAAIDELIKQRYELPAFSTLDRLAGRVRALVYGRICRAVQRRMAAEVQHGLETLFEVQLPSHRSAFSQLKLVPQSPTLSHLKVWQDRLAWLMELGAMEPLLKDIPPAIVKHFAAEARALDASELQDYIPAKRLTLLACLIRQTQMSTQDDLIDMFLKRMSTIQVRAKEALQL